VHSPFLARARVVYFHACFCVGLQGHFNTDWFFGVQTSSVPLRFDIMHGSRENLSTALSCPVSTSIATLIFLTPDAFLHLATSAWFGCGVDLSPGVVLSPGLTSLSDAPTGVISILVGRALSSVSYISNGKGISSPVALPGILCAIPSSRWRYNLLDVSVLPDDDPGHLHSWPLRLLTLGPSHAPPTLRHGHYVILPLVFSFDQQPPFLIRGGCQTTGG
jgi:hypothetical protein